MTIKKLDVLDFAKLGVHRPLTADEINEIHPQAAVDRSAAGGEEKVVDEKTYPHEQPLPDNVVVMPGVTSHDIPVEEVLRDAYDAKLVELVVVGVDEDGHEYVFRSNADMALAMWHVQRAVHLFNNEQDNRRRAAIAGEEP